MTIVHEWSECIQNTFYTKKNHLNISKQKKSFNKQNKLLNAMGMNSKLQTQFQNIQKVHLI